MKLDKLAIDTFRGFNEITMEFNGKSAVIFGYNGAGKTSILRAINLNYSNILDEVLKIRSNSKNKIQIDGMDVKLGNDECRILTEISAMNQKYKYWRYYKKSTNKRLHDLPDIKVLIDILTEKTDDVIELPPRNIPIFVNYGVHRLVAEVDIGLNSNVGLDQLSAYRNAVLNKLDFASFFEWFRHREDIENELKTNISDYEDSQLKAVKSAVCMFLNDVSDLRVFREENAFKVKKGNTWYNILQLSDGEKCIIALLGDLARRCAMANPVLDNPLEGEGLVLIDEIDLHLHPKWQRMIMPVLKKIFPNIQFVVTTHSPLVLSELDDETLVFATNSDIGDSITVEQINPVNGWTVDDILTQFMNVSAINGDTDKIISDAYDSIDDKEFEKAEELIDKLEEMTSGTNRAVVELRYLLFRRRDK